MLTTTILNTIETPNLIMRELGAQDGADLAGFMTQTRYQRHIAHRMKDQDAVNDFVRRQVAVQGDPTRRVFHLAAEERLSKEVVGDGFLISHHNSKLEIGWGLHPALWSMGFGSEIGRALLALGFEHLRAKSIWCKIMAQNTASVRLASRIGMRHDSTEENFAVGQGRFERVEIYGLTAEHYFDLPY